MKDDRISLVAYADGASAFFHGNGRMRAYHKIGSASIDRIQTLAYHLVAEGKVTINPGVYSPIVRWAIKPIKEQS